MNDLPSRHEAKRFVFSTFTDDSRALVPTIVRAYAIGDLMTREEWIETFDMEAASRMYFRLSGQHFRAEPIIAAALGEDTK